MATIRVAYKRTFQTRPYETQMIELSIEADAGSVADNQKMFAVLRKGYQGLEQVGDELMAEALAKPDPAGRK